MSRKKQETVVDVAATNTPPPTPIQVLRESLVSGLADVKPVIGRGGLYALSYVLIEVMENQLRLTGTNLEIVIQTVVPIQGGGAGWKLCLPAHTLDEVARAMPPESVLTLELEEGNQLLLTTDRTQTHIKGLPAVDFPLVPSFTTATGISLQAGAWSASLKQAMTAMAKDDALPTLTHIHMEAHNGRLVMTATDSHRLAHSVCGCPGVNDLVWLLPRMLAKLAADASAKRDGGGPVIFGWSDDRTVVFDVGATLILGKAGDVTFPNVMGIVKSTFETTDVSLVFDRAQLAQALKVVSVMMPDSRQMRLRLGQRELTLWSADDRTGETQQTVAYHKGEIVAGGNGDGLELAVNGRYLRDAVEASTGDLVLLRVASAARNCPIIVASVEEGAEDYHLIMPMHIT